MTLTARFPFRTIACLILAGHALMAHDPHDPMAAVAVSPNFAQDQTVFAATGLLSLKFGIYVLMKSTDGGVIWSAVQGMTNNAQIIQIIFSPAYAQDQTLYVAGTGGLFQSTNQGKTWLQLTKTSLLNLALSPNFAADSTLFAVTNKRTILKSNNRGKTFSTVTPPAALTAGLNVIAVSPNFAVDNTLLLGAIKDGIFESTDGGSTWVQVTSGQTVTQVTALAFSPNYSNDQTAFAGTYGTGMLVSANGGASWTPSNTGISDLNVTSLAFSPAYLQDSTVWISTAAAGVYQSNTSGAAWTVGALISRTLSNLTCIHYQMVAPASGGSSPLLYLATYEGMWTSSNGAQSWLYVDILPTRLIRHINLSPNYTQDQTVFANTYGGGNVWSSDGGTTWTINNTGMQLSYTDASAISPNYAMDGTAFSSNPKGLQKSSDRGLTWQLLVGLGVGTSSYARGLAVSPAFAQDSTVLVGLSVDTQSTCAPPATSESVPANPSPTTGPYVSTDGGNTWKPTNLTGVTGIISMAISPGFATDRTAFAASPTNGLYKSIDGGLTWLPLTLPITSKAMAVVAVTPSFVTDHTVLAGVVNGGILKSGDGGATWSLLAGTSSLRAMDIQVSPNYQTDQSFFVGSLQKGLLKFTNGGTKIVPLPFPDGMVTALALSPNLANDHTMFASGYHNLYKSTNSGNTWNSTAAPARMEESRQANSTYAPQNPPSIIYQGLWAGITPWAPSSTNAYMATSEAQDTAVLNFTGDGVRWVGWIGPNQGMAAIQLDGVPQTTVNLYWPLDQYQQTIWQMQGLTCGRHTLTITALPQQPGQTVSVDAFDVWIATCPTSLPQSAP